MKRQMVPSRAMISGELSWGFVALCYAISGSGLPPFGDGYLFKALARDSSPLLWAVMMGAPAIALLLLSAREWMTHCVIAKCSYGAPCWGVTQTFNSAAWRGRACLASIFGWGYMLKVLVMDLNRISIMVVVAAGGCCFMWWFYKENRRVRREINYHLSGSAVTQG